MQKQQQDARGDSVQIATNIKPHEPFHKHSSLSNAKTLPKIAGFDIFYQIGRGAMGSVYRGRQIKTGRIVAIKVLSCDLSERTDLVARFEREAYALKSLAHQNVVSIIDAGNVLDIHYLAMEFIDGITLRARINREPIELKEATFITKEILNGLRAAHRHGIIHRDLKPENVLLCYDGHDFRSLPTRVVVVDFGLVGIEGIMFDPHPNLTRSKVTMGTVNYMAPEQHVDAKRVDQRSDLYSAGVIFFEMLTKELPLGRSLLPNERGLLVPKEVDTILAKALARPVDERYTTAEDFLMDLESLSEEAMHYGDEARPHKKPSIKILAYKARYLLMLMVAGIFIAFGIKLSLSDQSARAHHNDKSSNES
jgi:serine/threonine protein kinase